MYLLDTHCVPGFLFQDAFCFLLVPASGTFSPTASVCLLSLDVVLLELPFVLSPGMDPRVSWFILLEYILGNFLRGGSGKANSQSFCLSETAFSLHSLDQISFSRLKMIFFQNMQTSTVALKKPGASLRNIYI